MIDSHYILQPDFIVRLNMQFVNIIFRQPQLSYLLPGRQELFILFFYTRSPSSKGSPHSGQNLGGWAMSLGSQPHLSQRYWGTPAGFFAPHSVQNLPLFIVPQEQFQPSAWTGLGAPHSAQNFPLLPAQPQLQIQPSADGAWLTAPEGWPAWFVCCWAAFCCCPIW